jgi:hypothetical protein
VSSSPSSATPISAPNPTPRSTLTIECKTAIDAIDEPPASYTTILGVVALEIDKQLQAADHGDTLFTKQGLVVRTGASFTLEVKAGSGLLISWGSGDPAERVVVEGCTGPKTWTVFAGGFRAKHTGCYELNVREGSREQVVRIGMGAKC